MQVAFGTTEKKVACRARPLVLGTPVRDQKYKVQQTPRGQFYPWGLLIPFWDLWEIPPHVTFLNSKCLGKPAPTRVARDAELKSQTSTDINRLSSLKCKGDVWQTRGERRYGTEALRLEPVACKCLQPDHAQLHENPQSYTA